MGTWVCVPKHRGDAAVEIPAHDLLVAGGLGVKVQEDHADVAGQRGQHAIGRMKRTIDRRHEDPAQEREDGHANLVPRGQDDHFRARGLGRIVGRTDDALLALQDGDDLAPLVDVIAQRDAVDAGGQQLAVDRRRQPGTARGVLGVGHDQIDRLLLPQSRRACVQICRPGLPTMSPIKSRRMGKV